MTKIASEASQAIGQSSKKRELDINNRLKSLIIKNFTVFAEVKIEFSAGLNVIIGDNATKRIYSNLDIV